VFYLLFILIFAVSSVMIVGTIFTMAFGVSRHGRLMNRIYKSAQREMHQSRMAPPEAHRTICAYCGTRIEIGENCSRCGAPPE